MRPFSWSRNCEPSACAAAARARAALAYPSICDGVLVVRVGGAHEVVVGHEGSGGELLEQGGALVAEQLRVDAGFRRRALDLEAVFVRPGAHEGRLALQHPPSLEDVGQHQRVEVPDVRR